MCEYPLLASRNSKKIDKIFVSTDCPVISRVSVGPWNNSTIKNLFVTQDTCLNNLTILNDGSFNNNLYVEKDICAVNLNVLTDLCFNNSE